MSDKKLLGSQLNRLTPEQYRDAEPSGLVVVLDNIRSAHNVGSIFRSCDSFGVDKLVLCGICALPPSAEIHKSALGAEFSVPWEHFDDTLQAISALREQGYTIISVEQTQNSVSLEQYAIRKDGLYAIILGNEVDGVQQSVVDASDLDIEVPQFGTKHSLNVSVCAGVVLWQFRAAKMK